MRGVPNSRPDRRVNWVDVPPPRQGAAASRGELAPRTSAPHLNPGRRAGPVLSCCVSTRLAPREMRINTNRYVHLPSASSRQPMRVPRRRSLASDGAFSAVMVKKAPRISTLLFRAGTTEPPGRAKSQGDCAEGSLVPAGGSQASEDLASPRVTTATPPPRSEFSTRRRSLGSTNR